VLVCSDERLIAKLVLKVNSKSFDSVAHRIGRRYTWQVLKEVGHSAFVNWLLKIIIVIRTMALLLRCLVAAVARCRREALRR
jgi:hypothetical protein